MTHSGTIVLSMLVQTKRSWYTTRVKCGQRDDIDMSHEIHVWNLPNITM